jgi:hypothetical protein
MIRNVVVGRVKNGVDPAEVERGLQELRDLRVPGVEFELFAGVDLRLREGTADFVITVDLLDEDAYRRYDADPEHNRIRRESLGPLCSSLERIQVQVPGASAST